MLTQNIILGSLRPDGSRRKDIEVKPGYVNQDEVPKYVIPQRRIQIKKTHLQPETTIVPLKECALPDICKIPCGDGVASTINSTKRLKRQRNRQAKAKRAQEQNTATKDDPISVDQLAQELSVVTLNDKSSSEGSSEITADKKIRKLRKKLREIENLIEKHEKNGFLPNDDELAKLNSKQSIIDKIASLESKLSKQKI